LKYVRSVKQSRFLSKYNDRILLCCNNNDHKTNKLLLSYLLHKLDIANIQFLSIPMIAANHYCQEEVYRAILSKIKLAITTGIGVIVLYDLDVWLQHFPKIMENILLSNLNDMCRDRNTLILATSNLEWNATNCWNYQWPHTVYQYFSSYQHHFSLK